MTEAQRTIYEALRELTWQYDKPPTIRELAEHTGRGVYTVHFHLRKLRAAGLVTWDPVRGRKGRTLRAL